MCIDYFHCGKVITLVENYILKLKTFLQESSYSSVTFKRIKTNHIQIKAEINGLKGVFIIDTGASNTCIDLENHKLFSLNNTLLTPHNAALTLECRKGMSVESCENVSDFLTKNEKLNKSNIVNFNIFN